MSTNRWKKLGLLGSLYMSQYIPVMFLIQALPVFMRQQGASLEAIGALSLLGLPLVFKVLWSPLIDRYGMTRWGHYRFWIVSFQVLVVCMTVVCAFLNGDTQRSLLLVGAFLMCVFCASQDIATDALAIRLLAPHERGLGNGIQVAGHELGIIIGGGGILILLNDWGWRNSLLILALLLLVALIPILLHQETRLNDEVKSANRARPSQTYFSSLINVCRQSGAGAWLLILMLYMAGGNMANTMFRPLLVDLGLSLKDIGWLEGVVSHSAGIVGAIATGFIVAPLGRKRSLLVVGLLQSATIALYLLPATQATSLPVLYLVAIVTQMALGAAGTVLFTLIMDRSERATAGTDFTTQTTFIFIGSIGASAISGAIAGSVGYVGVFGVSGAIALLSVALIATTVNPAESSQSSVSSH